VSVRSSEPTIRTGGASQRFHHDVQSGTVDGTVLEALRAPITTPDWRKDEMDDPARDPWLVARFAPYSRVE
jgi:hypothetical protein